ncbi:MAG: YicC family protein [Bacteroidaceae bacterium]|nr:YicC family protein [Bacteroidaceae bacterium]
MIYSMTGYGKSVVQFQDKKICVEVRSLNGKAMDLSTRLAPQFKCREMEIRTMLTTALERGKVDFALWVEQGEKADTPSINQAVMQGYLEQMNEISQNTGIALPDNLFEVVLRMPEVIARKEVYDATDEEWESVHRGIELAVADLLEFRRQEGEALAGKFRNNISKISELLSMVEPYEKERVEKIRARITESLEKLAGVDYDKNRLEQELIFYIEKLDVNEEKQRLTNHLNYFLSTMDEEKGQGKKLGFIAQEMGREINTLGSKSNHAEMQNIVVRMKDELEQIKEQVLNVM